MTRCTPVITHNNNTFHPAHAGGAFLLPCILTRCRAFILPGGNTALYKRLQRVLPCQCNYTTHATKQHTRLYSGFPCDCARSTAHDTSPTQAAIIPPATRWRAYTHPDALSLYQTPPPRRTLHRPAQPPIIIRYIRGQTMPAAAGQRLPCADHWQALRPAHLLRGQRLHLYRVSPAACSLAPGQRSGRAVWRSPPGGAVQQQGRGGRRGTIGGSRRISFRAVAR